MDTPTSNQHTYILDPESPTELARLIHFDQVVTRAMGGPLAEQTPATIAAMQRLLDLACGPGGWVLDVAYDNPHIEVEGVDISKTMIDYAYARARTQKLPNATFGIMDINLPLDYSDETFDLVNARFINGVLKRESWDAFIAECTRILRPGGVLRLTEMINVGNTTSPAFERIHTLLCQAMWRIGYGFSPDGSSIGITPVLPRLLREAHYESPQIASYAVEFSAQTPYWMDLYRNFEVGYQMALPLFVKLNLATHAEMEQLYQQMLIEMNESRFCGMWNFATVWGTRPT
jgi:ubiquinone/menaquinone biosynthesis C-methylase UbiE